MNEHKGSCHCGNLNWTLGTRLNASDLPARACQCGFCRNHGAVSTSDPQGEMSFDVRDPTKIIRYRFATRTAEFLICGRCGIYVGAQMKEQQATYAIANLRTLDGYANFTFKPEPMDYSAEDSTARRLRRSNRWTPVVTPA